MTPRKLPRRVRLVLGALVTLVPILAACAPAAVAGRPTDYSVSTHLGQRLRWNPCAPVHWRADLRNAPAGTLTALKSAVATLSSKSGIPFVYDGAATYVPQRGGPSGPAPLVISFGRRPGRPSASNYLSGGSNVGYGGGTAAGAFGKGKTGSNKTHRLPVVVAPPHP